MKMNKDRQSCCQFDTMTSLTSSLWCSRNIVIVITVLFNMSTSFVNCGNSPNYIYDYMEPLCSPRNPVSRTIPLNSYSSDHAYGYLLATNNSLNGYSSYLNCTITLRAQNPDERITVRFPKNLNIYRNGVLCEGSLDYLLIKGETKETKYCTGNPGSMYSSSNYLTFTFVTGYHAGRYMGFEFYYTVYRKGDCFGDEFQCAKVSGEDGRRCIREELKCDGRDNCGNWSDEGETVCGLYTGTIIAIAIVCSVVGVCLVVVFGYCVYASVMAKKQNGHRRRQEANGQSMEPIGEPVQPPDYSEPPPIYTFTNPVCEQTPRSSHLPPPAYDDDYELPPTVNYVNYELPPNYSSSSVPTATVVNVAPSGTHVTGVSASTSSTARPPLPPLRPPTPAEGGVNESDVMPGFPPSPREKTYKDTSI